MKVGDLVKNLNSERGLVGIVVSWTDTEWPDNTQNANHPVVSWLDGRTSWIMAHRVEVISEGK